MKKRKDRLCSFIWILATIIEWISVILFMLAMGYVFNIPLHIRLKMINPIETAYYIFAVVDIILFGILMLIERARDNTKNTILALYCGLVQIVLLIYKIKV